MCFVWHRIPASIAGWRARYEQMQRVANTGAEAGPPPLRIHGIQRLDGAGDSNNATTTEVRHPWISRPEDPVAMALADAATRAGRQPGQIRVVGRSQHMGAAASSEAVAEQLQAVMEAIRSESIPDWIPAQRSAAGSSGLQVVMVRGAQERPVRLTYEQALAIQEQLGTVSRALPPELFARIPMCSLSATDGTCCVCLCDYEDGDNGKKLPCGHKFHAGCIDEWFQISSACPVCRSDATV